MKKKYFLLLIAFLFVLRLLYGVTSEFWFEDELQIYLLGLKSYCTQTWPYYGPDLVYTNTQIPGALQGLLVSAAFYILPVPEAPALLLGVLSFIALSYLAYYLCKRFTNMPQWVVWVITLTTPWAMHFSTRVVNPSYVVLFSIPFFISLVESIDVYAVPVLKKTTAFFLMGLSTTMVMQIHLSWVLLLPLTGFAFLYIFKKQKKELVKLLFFYVTGVFIGAITLMPTLFIKDSDSAGNLQSNIVFNLDNIKNIFLVLTRYLSFAAYEIPYVMGSNTAARLQIIQQQWWMAPFAAFLYVLGFAQVILFIVGFFQKNENVDWKKMKWLCFGTYLLVFISFFFSVKGPSSHTFYLVFPLVLMYSFYCYTWLVGKKNIYIKILKIAALSGIAFHIGLGIDNYKNKSLYKNRSKVQEAIDKKDYTILGSRRSDTWGYGY